MSNIMSPKDLEDIKNDNVPSTHYQDNTEYQPSGTKGVSMKKTETYTKDVYYCDICGAKIENNVRVPYTTTYYQEEYLQDQISYKYDEHFPCINLCGYHSRMLGSLMVDCVKEALSFLNDKQKLIEIIKRKERS